MLKQTKIVTLSMKKLESITKTHLYSEKDGIVQVPHYNNIATSDGGHLRGLAFGQHHSERTLQRRRAVDDAVSELTGPGIEPKTFASIAMSLHYANSSCISSCKYYHLCLPFKS